MDEESLQRNDLPDSDRTSGSVEIEKPELPREANNNLPATALHRTPTRVADLDWDSAEDPDNPKNWPLWKRIFHTAIPALYGFVCTVGTSTYVPGIPFVQQQFGISREVALLPLSLYTLGFTVGPVLAAPISELYGRRVIYWTSLPLLVIFTAIAGAADNLAVLIIFRFLAGTGGSAALAVGAGTIADLWPPDKAGRAALLYILAPFLGPALGPLTGAYIIAQYDNDWKYSLWVILMIAAPIGVAAIFMKETSKTRLLILRERRRGGEVERKEGDVQLLVQNLKTALLRPLHMTVFEPLVMLISLYTGFAFAMIFSFFGSYNYVFQSVYHFNQKEIGLTFIGLLVGFFCAVGSFGFFDATLYRKAYVKANGNPAPEHRLYASMLGSFLLPIGLFWFAWSPRESVHWIVPVLAGVPFGWGTLAVFLGATTYLVDVYQAKNGASAVAANGILRYGFGAAFPLFTLQMYDGLGIGWAGSVFAFISLLLLPVPWIFFWKGKELRKRSHYETSGF